MVAHLLRLRLDLLIGSLQREHRTRAVLALLAVAVVTVVVAQGVLSLGSSPAAVAATVLTLGSAALLLSFFLAPILAGVRDPLDPRRFRVFGVDEKTMPALLALASLISVPSLAVIVVSACAVAVMIVHGTVWPLAVLLGAVFVASTLLSARVGMGIGAILLPERRPRELTTLFVLAVTVIAFPVAIFLASQEWGAVVPDAVATLTRALGFTPLAAATASAFAFGEGAPATAWICAAIAGITLGGLWMLWSWVVRHLLTSGERPAASRERAGLGWFSVLPANAFGAIAARSLIYWLRDRRYLVNILIVPVAGLLAVLPLMVAGVPERLVLVVPVLVMALFFGWLPHNDVAYDSTAFWIHVASGAGGLADRLGRLVPIVLVAVPTLAVGVSITLALVDSWALLPALAASAACLFLCGLGLSSIVSVVAPYAVSRPGDSPFQQPQRSSGHGAFGHAIALLGALALSMPTLWLLYRELTVGGAADQVFWTGVVTGAVVLVGGTLTGAAVYARRGERLMEFVETN